MFDRINIGGGTTHSYNKTEVVEHRAPTDESVKILRAMEKEALDSVLGGFLVQGNTLETVSLTTSSRGTGFDASTWHYAFRLNGQLYKGTVKGPEGVELALDQGAALRKAIERLSGCITHQLFDKAIKDMTLWEK